MGIDALVLLYFTIITTPSSPVISSFSSSPFQSSSLLWLLLFATGTEKMIPLLIPPPITYTPTKS